MSGFTIGHNPGIGGVVFASFLLVAAIVMGGVLLFIFIGMNG